MKPVSSEVNTDGWYTANQVLDMFDVSHGTLDGFVRKGLLKPVMGHRRTSNNSTRRVWLYNPEEFHKVSWRRKERASDPNEVAAKAFEMMDEGEDLRTMVRTLRITPDRVVELRAHWEDLGGASSVLGREARAALEAIVGPFVDVAELVDRVKAAVASSAASGCERCRGVGFVVDGSSSTMETSSP